MTGILADKDEWAIRGDYWLEKVLPKSSKRKPYLKAESPQPLVFEELTPEQAVSVRAALTKRFGERLDTVSITGGEDEYGQYIGLALPNLARVLSTKRLG